MNQIITNSTVLVTGGAGFIGSNLVDRLLKQNNKVVCFDNFSTGKRENLAEALKHPNFSLFEGDIRNFMDCQTAVKNCDYVLHQAALGSVPRSVNDPVSTTDVNIGGFVKMMTAAKDAGIKRFVYAASSSTYGDHPTLPKVEHQIGKALSPYAVTKYVDELFAHNFSEIYGLETIGLRYFNVYGMRQSPDGEYAAVIPKITSALIRHQSPIIYGDGSNSRDFTFIEDVIKAIQLAAITSSDDLKRRQTSYYNLNNVPFKSSSDSILSEVFNVAYGSRTTLIKLAQLLKDKLSRFDPSIATINLKFCEPRKGDVSHSLASVDKVKYLLGYFPDYDISKGLDYSVKWYFESLK